MKRNRSYVEKWLLVKLCRGRKKKQNNSIRVVCLSRRRTPECFFILFVSLGRKTHHRETAPLHARTHHHTHTHTQTSPLKLIPAHTTAATQQMWRAGFNFLAPRLSSQPHAFFITTILFPTSHCRCTMVLIGD